MIGVILLMMTWVNLSPIPYLASIIGTTVPALQLLLSILWGYPLAIIFNKKLRENTEYKNIIFALMGFDIAVYNFGLSFAHNLVPVAVIYLTTKLLGPGRNNAIITLIFNMVYLLNGYIQTESEDYDITWTMPHCVLTLKVIALSFDLWDGQKKKEGVVLSANTSKTAVENLPEILDLLGFIYFPACFLVGPTFSFRRYQDFVRDVYPIKSEETQMASQAMKRLLQGLGYLIAYQVGVTVFNMKYMLSDEFGETSIVYRHFYCGMWAHFALYKYISCWLLAEASCIRFGLSFNGYEDTVNGKVSQWDACNNIILMEFEGATKFQHYINSFNCNTNYFASEYVYKRLKFLGNRYLSQFFTLLFLALWHGIRSGYYMTFFNEYIIIYMEKELEALLVQTTIYDKIWNSSAKSLVYVFLKSYTFVFMGWSLAPFDLKIFWKWWHVYSSLYFSGFLIFLPWPLVYKPLLKKALKSYSKKAKET
ncbi:lysophospholipid acyltransferase 5 [Leptidea sinapis]|uniref:lysophospholipid acyltransferase 5 n=1 Tax=Leptidea sinapis TaxID=189913 RepID=UPI0021345D86|nr:lysophospholipid acyltransferase 5 [Leptidea sinapis]XP_050683773.1 lysophospholipid acyltransferase 5 [Leptidea sinapis]